MMVSGERVTDRFAGWRRGGGNSAARRVAPIGRRGVAGTLISLAVTVPALAQIGVPRSRLSLLAEPQEPQESHVRAHRWRLDDEQVLDSFLQATLGEGERTAARFDPWLGPVRPIIFGEASAGHRLVLGGSLAWLGSATGLMLQEPGVEPATLGVLFSDRPALDLAGALWDSAGAAFFQAPAALRAALEQRGSCFFLRLPARATGLLAAPGGPPLAAVPCLSRALLGVMGLRHPLPAEMPSVLSVPAVAVEPTPLDRLLLALASDTALRPGMSEAELRTALPALIARHRSWHGFDALADGLGSSDVDGEGDPFAPSTERTLRAFASTALPAADAAGYLVRWPAGSDVAVHLRGRVPAEVRAQLGWVLDWASAATTLRFRAPRHPREDGLTFAFAPSLDMMWDEHGPAVAAFFANDRRRLDAAVAAPAIAAEGALTLLHHGVPGGSLLRTLSLVATDGPPAITLRRLCREMLRSLGLRGGMLGYGHGLLDGVTLAFQPSALDERLLRLLYAETLPPGTATIRAGNEALRLLRN